MRKRRSLPIFLGAILVAAVLALLVQLRKHAPPEAARLLPGADGFFYINLQWMRRANLAGNLPPVSHDPEYEQFIQATGFQFERDLDEAAFAIHYSPTAPQKMDEARFSEVFVGRIDGEKLNAYLRKLSSEVEDYHSVSVYNILLDGRTLRVAVLGVDTVAASNNPDPGVIHGMIDRSRKLASPFGGPQFLRQYYKNVPLASVTWAILKVNPTGQPNGGPLGVGFLFPKPAVLVASIRYLGSAHFKAEAFSDSQDDARQLTEKVSTFLNLFHSAEISVGGQGPDPDVKQFFDSLKVEQRDDRAVLSAVIPVGFLRKAIAESPRELQNPETPQPSQAPPAPQSPGPKNKARK
jgi:hypothetical protein